MLPQLPHKQPFPARQTADPVRRRGADGHPGAVRFRIDHGAPDGEQRPREGAAA